ncbi:hypothetical protein NIES2101_03285 [Calothrix sp. HK-06]|nr:hypothetical protein NIES2101_03285 [Calothrix sp. HK-06]
MTTIETRKLTDIATWMVPVKPTDLPPVLKGVFFMDGNPLPDHCITMHNLEWDEKNLVLFLPVSAPLQWTFHQSIPGWILLIGAQISRFTYKIKFEDNTLQRAQITPLWFDIPIPKWLIDATMYQDANSNGDTWQRKNLWLGGTVRVGEYTLRRVVDEQGSYTKAFQDMLTKVQSECLVIV